MQPERRLRSERIFDGRIVALRVDRVSLPDGGEAIREVVEHRASAVIVPVDEDGNLVLVRQYRYAVGRVVLEAPAGVVDGSESPEECAQRELQEEIGYAATDITLLGGFWPSPGFCDEFIHAFLARGLEPSRLAADEDENIEVVRYPVVRVVEMIRAGEIQDAKTVAAVLLAVPRLEEASQVQ